MHVTLIDRDNNQHALEAADLPDLYERLVSTMQIDGLCGGCASCATCHVYIDCTDTLPEPSAQESEVLEGLRFQQVNSRLLCQLAGSPETLTLTLADME